MNSELITELSEWNAKKNSNGSNNNFRGRRDGFVGQYNNIIGGGGSNGASFIIEKKIRKEDENWINLRKIGRTSRKESRGFYLILKGEGVVENIDGNIMGLLSSGDYFGEKLLFPTNSVTDFGLIKVKSDTVEMLFMTKKLFHRIPFYEREIMKKNCQDRKIIKNLQHLYDIKYAKRKI